MFFILYKNFFIQLLIFFWEKNIFSLSLEPLFAFSGKLNFFSVVLFSNKHVICLFPSPPLPLSKSTFKNNNAAVIFYYSIEILISFSFTSLKISCVQKKLSFISLTVIASFFALTILQLKQHKFMLFREKWTEL